MVVIVEGGELRLELGMNVVIVSFDAFVEEREEVSLEVMRRVFESVLLICVCVNR